MQHKLTRLTSALLALVMVFSMAAAYNESNQIIVGPLG